MTHHPIYDEIKAAVETAEGIAERAVAAFQALLNGVQHAADHDDDDELQSILDTAQRTATVLGPVVANPGTTMPDTPPLPVEAPNPAPPPGADTGNNTEASSVDAGGGASGPDTTGGAETV